MWFAAVTLAIAFAMAHTHITAQEAGESGSAGAAGGFGGGGGGGGAGGFGGGGGGFGGLVASGGIAAHGEFVFIIRDGTLFKFAAYDLKLINKMRLDQIQQAGRRAGARDAAAGRGGQGGAGGAAGQGGAGGFGGGFGGAGHREDVAAYGDFVYVLRGDQLHKLTADGLKSEKTVKLNWN
jgi:hypothetical protein